MKNENAGHSSFEVARKLSNLITTRGRKQQGILMALDGTIVLLCLWAAFALRYTEWWPVGVAGVARGIEVAWWLFVAAPLCGVLVFRWLGLYRPASCFDTELFNKICVAASLQALLVAWIAAVVVRLEGIPRSIFVIYWLVSLGLLLGSRAISDWLSRSDGQINVATQRVIIYGTDPAGAELAASLQKSGQYVPIAFIDDKSRSHQDELQGLKVYPATEIGRLVERHSVRQVWLAIPTASTARRREVTTFLEQFSLEVIAHPAPSWPSFVPEEIDAVRAVLDSGRVNYWTGQQCREFEQAFSKCCQTRYAVAVANGTVALELALYAIGVSSGDEVVVTPRTFIASASAVIMRGATPVFADVDPVSQNITADSIRAVLSPRTKAIITVHLAGWPCDMDSILALAAENNIKVVEDCAQAHGATYRGRAVGSLGDVAAFSFCQDKIMTTGGEGGMLTTNDRDIWERAWSFKDHGKSYDSVYNRNHSAGFRWLHESFGTNWRMTEMQAAIGLVQLRKLPEWHARRCQNAVRLTQRLRNIPALRLTEPPDHIGHAYYKYYAFVRPERLRQDWSRDRIMAAINAEGVSCFSGSCSEIYLEKAFDVRGLRPARRLPAAKELGEASLMFLVHPTLSAADMDHTCQVVEKVFSAATSQEISVRGPVGIATSLPA